MNKENLKFHGAQTKDEKIFRQQTSNLGHLIMCSVIQTYSWMQHFSVLRFPYSPMLTTADCRNKTETLYTSWGKPTENAHILMATLIPTELLSHDNE